MNSKVKSTVLALTRIIPDELYLRMAYWCVTGKRLHLNPPVTYNEKLQWLKINNRNPLFTQMVDKVGVRDVIARKVGEEYLVPVIGLWNSVDEIVFESLPNQFVLKCTHDSGDLIICRDKSTLDVEQAKEKLEKGLKTDLYQKGREWPYKNVKPRVYGEVYMSDEGSDQLTDYKVYCFNGIPKLIQVDYDRFTNHKRQFYDTEWHLTDIAWHIPSDKSKVLPKPANIEKILEIAALLSREIPFLRVDFYVVGKKLYIGETTFFPGAGFGKWMPEGTDEKLGEWLTLDLKRKEE